MISYFIREALSSRRLSAQVKKGANVNCRLDEKGFTPLMFASEGGWAHIVSHPVFVGVFG